MPGEPRINNQSIIDILEMPDKVKSQLSFYIPVPQIRSYAKRIETENPEKYLMVQHALTELEKNHKNFYMLDNLITALKIVTTTSPHANSSIFRSPNDVEGQKFADDIERKIQWGCSPDDEEEPSYPDDSDVDSDDDHNKLPPQLPLPSP